MDNPNYQELKEAVGFLFDIPAVYEKAKADGKIDFGDLQYVLGLFSSAKNGIEGLGNPLQRFRALSASERGDLVAYVELKFDLKNDGLEELIERWFEFLYLGAELVVDTIAFGKPAAQA